MKVRPLKNRKGQGMSEYLILVLLIAVASITATQTVGHQVYEKLHQIKQELHDQVQLEKVRTQTGT